MFDLYVWHSPRDLDAEHAAAVIGGWEAAGGDPATSPFEPSTDIGWFYRELKENAPDIDAVSDAVPTGKAPIWMSGTDEPPARVVAIRLRPEALAAELELVYSLAMKYDLILFDARNGVVRKPLEAMTAYASATFWPRGAIRSVVVGGIGAGIAVGAWVAAIPIVSGIAIVVGVFLAVLCAFTLVHEARVALGTRRSEG